MSLGLFKNVINKICFEIIYLIYMYKKGLALNNLQLLICHKTKPKPHIFIHIYTITSTQSPFLYMHKFSLKKFKSTYIF